LTINELGKLYLDKRTQLLLQRVPLDGWVAYVSVRDADELNAEHNATLGRNFPFGSYVMGAKWAIDFSLPKGEIRIWRTAVKLNAKFYGEIKKVKDDSRVPDDEYVVFLAKDNAFAAILPAYRDKCIELGCDAEQIAALDRMLLRLDNWRALHPKRLKNPDAHDEKLLG